MSIEPETIAMEGIQEISTQEDTEIQLIKTRLRELEDACITKNYININAAAALLKIAKSRAEDTYRNNPEKLASCQHLIKRANEDYETATTMLAYKPQVDAQGVAMTREPVRTQMKFTWVAVPFDGNPEEWAAWYDMFKSSVDDNIELDSHTKMKCLSQCLQGEALEVLGSLSLTGDNYEKAIKKLVDRMNDPGVLSKTYYAGIKRIRPAGSMRAQRRVLDKLQSVVRNLESISDKIPMDNQQLVTDIWSKFPMEVIRDAVKRLEEKKPDLIFSLAEVLQSLEKTIKIEDYIARQLSAANTKAETSVGAAVLAVVPKRTLPTPTEVKCLFCKMSSHGSNDCKKYPSIGARRAFLKGLKKCENCIKQGHATQNCRNPPARCTKCGGGHHIVMCIVRSTPDNKRRKYGNVVNTTYNFLQTFTCTLLGNDSTKTLVVRGLLDTGSTFSYIHTDIVNKLSLSVGKHLSLEFLRFRDLESHIFPSREVLVTIQNQYNDLKILRLLTAHCIVGDLITAPCPNVVHGLLPSTFQYADYDIFLSQQRSIQLLIGIDLYHELVNIQQIHTLPSGLHLLNSFFGWIPSGGIHTNIKELNAPSNPISNLLISNANVANNLYIENSKHAFDNSMLEILWSLEALGIEDPGMHKDDDNTLEKFRKTTYIQSDGRINVRFPWKTNKINLPTNFRVALARLQALIDKTPKHILELGNEHLQMQIKEGIIEPAPYRVAKDAISFTDKLAPIHYLPHRWIFSKDKIRIVYDASAKTKGGASLNTFINPGPKLTENLVRLLLNFRLHAVGLTADIEKAYLQIALNEVDRDAVRFLWLKNPGAPATPDNLYHLRLARLPFGINASPFLLNIVLQELLGKPSKNKWLSLCQHNFYVDNFLMSVPSSEDALQIYKILRKTLSSIHMNLRDWATNDKSLLNTFSNTCPNTLQGKISVLGLFWDVNNDTLSFKVPVHVNDSGTKRNMLRTLASIYDPLGLISPCVLPLKMLIQTCWKNKYEWDTPLPADDHAMWLKIYNNILPYKNIIIPRRYWQIQDPCDYFLHIFCDASNDAYACCAYLICKNENLGLEASQLVFSKSKITPAKISKEKKKESLTIPKLELLAVLIGSRTAHFLQHNLSITLKEINLWTDATTVLQWLHATEILPPFINNRIVEIKRSKNVCINYVPTEENPADLASRGKPAVALHNNTLWWNGPLWIAYKELWPRPPINVKNYDGSNIVVAGVCLAPCAQSKLILPERVEKWHSWRGQVRIMRYVFLFYFRCKKQDTSFVELTQIAEKALVKEVQWKYYHKIYHLLKKGKTVKDVDLFLDDENIIRYKGRLHYARFPWEITHPILLPRKSHITVNYIKYIHILNKHIGTSHTLAKVREKFWVPQGRMKVRSVIHNRYHCRYWELYPLIIPSNEDPPPGPSRGQDGSE